MADLALNDSLIDEYLKYKFQEDYTPDTIRKLFKYIQPFSIREGFFDDPSMVMPMESDPLIEIVDDCSDEELVEGTVLKLMLVHSASFFDYRTLNINDNYERLKPKYVGTYLNKMGKDKALNHIKALLSDANWVKIIDSYIDVNSSQWNENKNILGYIIPLREVDLKIESGSTRDRRQPITKDKQNELNAICSDWAIGAIQYNDNLKHDRYIETGKLKILLSGGLYNLSTSSNKDFTYVVEIKS